MTLVNQKELFLLNLRQHLHRLRVSQRNVLVVLFDSFLQEIKSAAV